MVLRRAAAQLPRAPGVYRFRAGTRVLYVGRATDLRSRVRSYAGDLGGRSHLRRMVEEITSVEAVECASVHEAAWLERTLLEQSLHRWNRVRGGQEVPCWVVLDNSPRTAGVTLVTTAPQGASYGPYLGTERTGALLSGLRRVAPVELTRTSPSTFDAELAAVAGVGPEDRERLSALVAGVLRREGAAVAWACAALAARRDAAVHLGAYETAGRITVELEAFEWAAAPQRASGSTLPDADLAAYSDGLLVGFRVREGRLGSWTVRPSTASAAARRVAATPAEWREFAAAAASLAVRLRDVSP